MERRQFMEGMLGLGLTGLIPDLAFAARPRRLLVLVELKGVMTA